MELDLLIVYATRHGSTREVAAAIWRELGDDYRAEVKAAEDVRNLDGVRAVVLGGCLYMGHWHHDAVRFLKRFRSELAEIPLAVYALGPKTMAAEDVAGSRKQLEHALARVTEIDPRSVAVFGGVINPKKLPFPFNHLPKSDARDWDEIRSWTRELPDALELSRERVPVAA